MDLKKAFDTVSRKGMVLVLAKHGVPPKPCAVSEALYAKAEVYSEPPRRRCHVLESTTGVFQGCGSSPALFNFMVDAWYQAVEPRVQEHVLKFRSGDATAAYGVGGKAPNVRDAASTTTRPAKPSRHADDDARDAARTNWKVVVATSCSIPEKEKSEKTGGWTTQADDDASGAWPTPPADAGTAGPAECWTDGSSLNNGKLDAAAGAGAFFSEDAPDNISQPLDDAEAQTNNRGEAHCHSARAETARGALTRGIA